jgi:hypothetical protein
MEEDGYVDEVGPSISMNRLLTQRAADDGQNCSEHEPTRQTHPSR